MEVEPNIVFIWEKNLTLRAKQRVFVKFPGQILLQDKAIENIFEHSNNDAQISFHEYPDERKGFAFLTVELNPGDTLKLLRTTQAIIQSPSNEFILFDVV